MYFFGNEKPGVIQSRLKKGFFIGFALIGIVVTCLVFLKIGGKGEKEVKKESVGEFVGVANSINDKSQWIFSAQGDVKKIDSNQSELTKRYEELKAELEALKSSRKNDEGKEAAITEGGNEKDNDKREEEFVSTSSRKSGLKGDGEEGGYSSGILSDSWGSDISFTGHVHTHIPAGSYVRGVLLSGVNVSAGVDSSGRPQPVLMRLVNEGSLPNGFFGQMKQCRVTAAAFGDLSSERAFMRLEKLSCVKKSGEIISVNVEGYVSGEDGANGMRGRIITRDGDILRRGFVSGLLSGMTKGIAQSFTTQSVNPLGGITTKNAQGTDIMKQAGAEGTANAFEMMAKYSIARAEQYQPVIQIGAGREVYVVFQETVKFGNDNRTEDIRGER
jgi:hypothetical protein